MRRSTKWVLFIFTVIYMYFVIGSLKSPSPFRYNWIVHLVYWLVVIFVVIIQISINRKRK